MPPLQRPVRVYGLTNKVRRVGVHASNLSHSYSYLNRHMTMVMRFYAACVEVVLF